MAGRLMDGATAEYRAARDELRGNERLLDTAREDVAARRRALPPGPEVPGYRLAATPDGHTVTLPELFADGQRSLFVYSMMYGPDWPAACPMCTMWVDGLNGVAEQLRQRVAVAVVAAAGVPTLTELAERRGWNRLPVLSSAGTSWGPDTGASRADGAQCPTVLVFDRADGVLRLAYQAQPGLEPDGSGERGIDAVCPTWGVLDLLPEGRGDWYPAGDYSFHSAM